MEELILDCLRRHTRAELLAQPGVDPKLADRLWRSMGLSGVHDDEVVFTDRDRDALCQFRYLA